MIGTALGSALRRTAFGFSADGRHAAALAAGAAGGRTAELWRLADGTGVHAVPLPAARPEPPGTLLLAGGDGRVLTARPDGGRWRLALLSPGDPDAPPGTSAREHALGSVRAPSLRLLPDPAGALLLAVDERPVSTVWRLVFPPAESAPPPGAPAAADACGPAVEPLAPGRAPFGGPRVAAEPAPGVEIRAVAEIAGRCSGGIPLSDGVLGLDRTVGGVSTIVAVDLAAGGHGPLLEISPGSSDRLLLADPASGLLVVRSDAPGGGEHLGWAVHGNGSPVRFPECLRALGPAMPLAAEPVADGHAAGDVAVLLRVDGGAAGPRLAVWHPGSGRVAPIRVEGGRPGRVAHWSAREGLRLPWSAPERPTGIAGIRLDVGDVLAGSPEPPAWHVDGSYDADPDDPARAEPVALPGCDSPSGAVAHGTRRLPPGAWRTAPNLVVVIPSAPECGTAEFDPVVRHLTARGMTVLTGVAGGEVLPLVEGLALERRGAGLEPPAVLGSGGGAGSALRAACGAPRAVSRCAVVAPPPAGAGAADALDALRRCDRLEAPLLVVSGEALRRRLVRQGRVEGRDFTCVAGGGDAGLAALTGFLCGAAVAG